MEERQKPIGWPENTPLPKQEETEKIFREGKEKLRKEIEKLEKEQRIGKKENPVVYLISERR